jgi:hypothetical protein
MRDIIQRHRGDCKGFIHLKTAQSETVIAMAESWGIQPGDALKRDVNGLLGYPAVRTQCADMVAREDNGNGRGRRKWNGKRN